MKNPNHKLAQPASALSSTASAGANSVPQLSPVESQPLSAPASVPKQPPQSAPAAPEQSHPPGLSFGQDPRGTALLPLTPPLSTLNSQPFPALQSTAVPLPALQTRPGAKPRNGKIAHLPQAERDMVNRMLANNLPHLKIAVAVRKCGFFVTPRNVSNWKTHGGYKEWCAAQAQALELRTFQDNLTEFLRRHDAAELSEVGLQSAATNLSAILLRPDLMRELLSDPEKYSRLIDLQCRLAREIQALQRNRDEAARSLGPAYKPELIKRRNEQYVESIREKFSYQYIKPPQNTYDRHRNFFPKQLEPIK